MSQLSKWIDKHITHKTATRNAEAQAMQAANEQISFYKQQKDTLHAENEKLSQQKEVERKRIQEKQIRALRRNFRAPGFLDSATPSGASPTLG